MEIIDEYFKSKKDKLLFLLLEVDGKKRNDCLGITRIMYHDGLMAKKWYNDIHHELTINPTPTEVERVTLALTKLDSLYKILTLR